MPTSPPDRLHHLRRFLAESPWAMLPSALAILVEIVERRALGVRLSDDEIAASIHGARRTPPPAAAPGSIAVLPIFGPIVPRANVVEDISGPGATSAELVERAFRAALADPNVASILLDVDSPGGNVQGVPELSATIRSARGQKPVIAVVNHTAASAAYWLASQADEIVVTPSGDVGSIGVFTVHDDLSAAAEKAGVRRTYIAAGAHKVEGNPFEPLSDGTRQYLQERVDAVHDEFVRDVARGRRVAQQTVRDSFGQGRMVKAADAVKLGMADRIGTFQETVDRLAARNARAAGARAEGTPFEFTAADYLELFGRELQPLDDVGVEAVAPLEQVAETPPETTSDERDRFRLRLALGGGA